MQTFEKLSIPLEEQKLLSGVAVDAVFDRSVATTFRSSWRSWDHLLFVFRGGQRPSEIVKKYLGSVVPYTDNFCATLNSRSSATARSPTFPRASAVRWSCRRTEISARNTGQFERTLIVAEEGARVSYLEGCTADADEHQLHAAVVELVALDNATIKNSTIQNWYPGDKNGKGGIYNFVTKRGKASRTRRSRGRRSDRLRDHLEY